MAMTLRRAAVAGAFYPGDAVQLGEEVKELLDDVECLEPRLGFPKALIVPHAGYIYSGPVAAQAYDALAPGRGIVKRVVLLGPVHRVPVRGLALPASSVFETPLGRLPIDAAAVQALAGMPQVVSSEPAHAHEHSLEVQLPFLQRVLREFSLVPLAVGDASVADVAQVLERLWGGEETVVVISTDLSHYHGYDEARRIDGNTLARIAGFATDLRGREACGARPLNGFLDLARRRGMRMQQLAACNSGDTAGGKDRVVGYSSFALHEPGSVSLESAGPVLLDLARGAIEQELTGRAMPPADGSWLRQRVATFVTLTSQGRLRGCIGSLVAHRALGEDVAHNACAAAFRDPRFPKLAREEWAQCDIEVSLLSPPKPIRFAHEADLLAQIQAGEDGLILEYDGKRATYLPQVWQGIPEKRRFLTELLKKAGLPADTRLARCKVKRYRAKKFHGRALVA